MSLASCMKKAGKALSAEDKAAIIDAARGHREAGKSASDAAMLAVDERIKHVNALLVEAGKPRPVASPKPKAKAKPEASLTQAISRLGGLPSALARDVTGETPFQANRMYPGLFRKNGIDLSTHIHNGSLDDFLPPAMRSDVRDESGTVDTDEAVAYIENVLRNGEARTLRSWDTQEAIRQDALNEAQFQEQATALADEWTPEEIERELDILEAANTQLSEIAYAEQESYALSQIEDVQPEDAGSTARASKSDPDAAREDGETERPSLDLTSQSEAQIRAEEAKKARDAAAKSAQDNAPSPEGFTLTGSNRAADVGAAAGQNTLFQPQSKYGQQDLFASTVPDSDRANLVERVNTPRLDGINAAAAVNRAARRDLPGRYATGVTLTRGATHQSSVATVNSLKDAAHATRSLADLVREHVDVLVTDDAGKILAVQRMFAGATDQTAAYPGEIIKFATSIKGAASFYVSHNHPSDNRKLSNADRSLSDGIAGKSRNIGPQYQGIVAVTSSGYSAYSVDFQPETGSLDASQKQHDISYLEERIERRGYLGPVIDNPVSAAKVIADISAGEQGIVFMDASSHPTGFFPIAMGDAKLLKNKDVARDIVAAAYRSRASTAIIATQGQSEISKSYEAGINDGARNIGTLLARIEVPVVDIIDDKGKSRAKIGDPLSNDILFNKTSGTATPFDKLLHAGIAEGRTATETLKAIQKASKNPFYRELAGVLLKAGVNPALELGNPKGLKFSVKNRAAESFAAAFFPKANKVQLFTEANAERNLLHEIMHAATFQAIRKPGMASGQLRALFSHVKRSGQLKGMYGMENMDEFIAEAFSNPKFQAALKGVDAAKLTGGKIAHAFDWFVNIVRSILGLPKGTESALSQVIDIGTALIDQQRNMLSANSISGAMGNVDDSVMGNIAEGVQDQIRQRANDLMSTQKTFNWWNNTVGTQYAKAEKDADFKRVFDATQQYIGDVSRLANAAADMAGSLLPKTEGLRDVLRKDVSNADRAAIAKPIYQGTLTDQKVYSDQELREQFALTDDQIGLYKEHRAAVNQSLNDLFKTDALRYVGKDAKAVRDAVMSAPNAYAAADVIAQHLDNIGKREDIDVVQAKAGRVQSLKEQGYAPLMRFGRYAVYTTDKNGETIAFTLHENERDATKNARMMRETNPGATVVQSVMPQEAYKLYAGMEPETLELFAEMSGVEATPMFQEYLKMTKSNRSAMKRLIQRKKGANGENGVAGFDEDPVRGLAAFITSNARAGSKNLNFGDMKQTLASIEKTGKGDVFDQASKLVSYVQDPQEEAQAIRGLLFVNYIGGSVASALVNLTQPLTMTFPYLSQFGTALAAKELTSAMRTAIGKGIKSPDLAAALKRAEADGIVSPQEIHQLEAEASGRFGKNQYVRKGMYLWGSMFSLAEQYNRRVTFIAAYNMAKANKVSDPFAFAEKAVQETQGIYNKGNRPNWARSAVGATIFTFKQFSISYLEFLTRLPNKEKGIALGILLLTAGIQGMPGADDADDLIDALGQQLGYDTNSKAWKTRALTAWIGRDGAEVVMRGTSAWPGVPFDIAGRMSMGNLAPGTAAFTKTGSAGKEFAEVFGAAGSFAGGIVEAVKTGNPMKAAPVAIRNLGKAVDMYTSGMYRDEKGRKVIDTDGYDAIIKGLGFQPAEVALDSRQAGMVQQSVALVKVVESDIVQKWAEGIVENDPAKTQKAAGSLMEWNAKNPGSPIGITSQQITQRAREMMTDRQGRLLKRAPKEIRAAMVDLYQ